LIFFVRRVNL